MRLILHTANVVSDTKNCFYPNRVEVTSAEELHEAAKFDHVCAEYRKDYRSKNNFVKSNVLVMDCRGKAGGASAGCILCDCLQPESYEGKGRLGCQT